MYQISPRSGTNDGLDIAQLLGGGAMPAAGMIRGSTGALKYASSRGCSGSRMSKTRSPERMNEQATMPGSTRDGTLQ